MISIGIDVSKGKSLAFGMDENGVILLSPQEFEHTQEGLHALIQAILALPETPRVTLENTGFYHLPVVLPLLDAGIFVSVVNPILTSKFSKTKMRPGKTDKLDAMSICRFGLAHWSQLTPYLPPEQARQTLQLYSRHYHQSMKLMTKQKVNFHALLDKVMPGICTLLCDQAGRSKLSDFAMEFWHFDNINSSKETTFVKRYAKWIQKKGYRMNESKAKSIYALSQNAIPLLPCSKSTQFLVWEAARTLKLLEESTNSILTQMQDLASSLPEFPIVCSMKGAGPKTAPRLIAEIGDVTRFHSASALIAYAGLDAPPFQSGMFESSQRRISKRGNKYLRKVGYETMASLMSNKPQQDNAVYLFICKKQAEGKHSRSAYMAGLNKFLRIYYARVKQQIQHDHHMNQTS